MQMLLTHALCPTHLATIVRWVIENREMQSSSPPAATMSPWGANAQHRKSP